MLTQERSDVSVLTASKEFPKSPALYELAMSWNMDSVKRRVKEKHPEVRDIEDATEQYLRFMYLTAVSGEGFFVPSEDTDAIWHTHLLFTHDYADFSNQLAGYFIHHSPLEDKLSHAEVADEKRRITEACMNYFGYQAINVSELCCTSGS